MAEEHEGTTKCWRCGMILPEHELQLLDNQWHCAYCYMDVKMLQLEEEKAREHSSRHRKEQEHAGGDDYALHPAHISSDGKAHSHFYEEHSMHKGGWCMKCGCETEELYVFGSRHLCLECFSHESGKEAGGWTVMIKSAIKHVLQVVEKKREKQEVRRKVRDDFGRAKNDVEGKKKPAK